MLAARPRITQLLPQTSTTEILGSKRDLLLLANASRKKMATNQQSPVHWSTLLIIYVPAFGLLPLNSHVHTNCPPKNTVLHSKQQQSAKILHIFHKRISDTAQLCSALLGYRRNLHAMRSFPQWCENFHSFREFAQALYYAIMRTPAPTAHMQRHPVLLAFLGVKAYCSQTGWGSHKRLRKGDSALTPRIAQKDAILHLTRIVPTKGSWPTCFFAGLCLPAAVMVLRVFFCPSAAR